MNYWLEFEIEVDDTGCGKITVSYYSMSNFYSLPIIYVMELVIKLEEKLVSLTLKSSSVCRF